MRLTLISTRSSTILAQYRCCDTCAGKSRNYSKSQARDSISTIYRHMHLYHTAAEKRDVVRMYDSNCDCRSAGRWPELVCDLSTRLRYHSFWVMRAKLLRIDIEASDQLVRLVSVIKVFLLNVWA